MVENVGAPQPHSRQIGVAARLERQDLPQPSPAQTDGTRAKAPFGAVEIDPRQKRVLQEAELDIVAHGQFFRGVRTARRHRRGDASLS